jgi:hypothetical protein
MNGSSFLQKSTRAVRGFAISVTVAIVSTAAFGQASAVPPADAAATMAVLEQKMREVWNDDAVVNKLVRAKYPRMSEEQYAVLREHLKFVVLNEDVLQRLVASLTPAVTAKFSRNEMQSYMAEVGLDLQVKGLSRLSDDDMVLLLSMTHDLMKWMPADVCKMSALNQLNALQMQALEAGWMSTLPIERFQQILAMYRRAILAEAANYPARRSLTESQRELVKKALGDAVWKQFAASGNADIAFKVVGDIKGHEPAQVCSVMLDIIKAHIDMEGLVGKWAVMGFVESMASPN